MNRMKKTIVLPVAALALMAMLAYGVGQVKADDQYKNHPLVQFIAERFDLDEEEVLTAMEDFQEQRHEEMGVQFENRLTQAVLDGKITDEQREMILQKHEEMRVEQENNWMTLQDMTADERRDEIMARHEELKSWAEENGVDLSYFNVGVGRGQRMHNMDGGMGMGW